MRAILYIMCSAEQVKRDIMLQFNDMRRFCSAQGFGFDEVIEHSRDCQGNQPKLQEVIRQISLKRYNILVVHSLARFSQGHPRKTYETLSLIVDTYQCRFVSIFEGLDSADKPNWLKTMRVFAYFAHMSSQYESIKAENVIKDKKDQDKYTGKRPGRPMKDIDGTKLLDIKKTGVSIRKATDAYNDGLPRERWISRSRMAKAMAEQGS